MSKMDGLQQALKNNSGKANAEPPQSTVAPQKVATPAAARKPSGREGKDNIGAWLNSDFGASLRMVQLRKRKDADGRKIYLDDLIAEALNDLFLKYDVPTVYHE
jgi:hypothetical protein